MPYVPIIYCTYFSFNKYKGTLFIYCNLVLINNNMVMFRYNLLTILQSRYDGTYYNFDTYSIIL